METHNFIKFKDRNKMSMKIGLNLCWVSVDENAQFRQPNLKIETKCKRMVRLLDQKMMELKH